MNDNIKYYKGRYMITFYKDTPDKMDERFIAAFNNPIEICEYKFNKVTDDKLTQVKVELCNALKRVPSTTRMLDGSSMKVYLVDMLEEQEEQERRDKCMATKRFVKISSSINIEVYGNLDAIEVINAGSKAANAKSGWTNIRVLIKSGAHWYPSKILEWESIKKLSAKEIITIGEQRDSIENQEELAHATSSEKTINKGYKALEAEREKIKKNANLIKANESEAKESTAE